VVRNASSASRYMPSLVLFTLLMFSEDDSFRWNLKFLIRFLHLWIIIAGLTWIFGALAVGEAAVVFFYLFALCNCVQGLVIFIFQLLLDHTFDESHSNEDFFYVGFFL
jgi:hypothetical protein